MNFGFFAECGFPHDDRRKVGVAHAGEGVAAQAARRFHEFFAEELLVEADDRIPFVSFVHPVTECMHSQYPRFRSRAGRHELPFVL
jgi:hypothetical protein